MNLDLKNGCIIDSNDFKTTPKSECLKSFDGKISGKVNGWIFAKSCLWKWRASRQRI